MKRTASIMSRAVNTTFVPFSRSTPGKKEMISASTTSFKRELQLYGPLQFERPDLLTTLDTPLDPFPNHSLGDIGMNHDCRVKSQRLLDGSGFNRSQKAFGFIAN